ncbi:DUF4878 domain-containing protein [Bacteroides ihuae]|uniref:DUF4878 domain-containing protein n=1 Tax=Bacteroides ihuae TaxID=1852362 RepID=UPI0008DAF812|nr:DUF4878 domain-containing protein [Bacteroides ihuae]
MKNVFYLGLFAMTMFLATACSSDSPGAAAKKYAGYIQSGEYDKFANAIVLDEKAKPEDVKKSKEMIVALLKEKGSKSIEEKGGIKTIEILSETISSDKKSAQVVLKQTYGNGDTEDNNFDLVKQDGTWKIVMKK